MRLAIVFHKESRENILLSVTPDATLQVGHRLELPDGLYRIDGIAWRTRGDAIMVPPVLRVSKTDLLFDSP